MNFGMQDIQNIIYRQLVQGNANVTGGRGKFAKDLAKRIYELVEGENMNADMRMQALARGIPDRAIKIHDKLCKALGFEVMQLTPFASDVYEWVGTQEAQGQSISAFWMVVVRVGVVSIIFSLLAFEVYTSRLVLRLRTE